MRVNSTWHTWHMVTRPSGTQIGAFSPSFSVSDPEAESVPDTAFVTALEKVCG